MYLDGVCPPTAPSYSSPSPNSSSPPNNGDDRIKNGEKTSSYTDLLFWTSLGGVNKNQVIGQSPTAGIGSSVTHLSGKSNANQHLKLLQTIREQDEGESR